MDIASSTTPYQSTNPLITKLQKVLDTRIENDEDLMEGLKTMSDFFSENNIRTRRNLKSDIEKRSVGIHGQFLKSFTEIKLQLDEIHDVVSGMNHSCVEMAQRLNKTKQDTHHLISQTTLLQSNCQKLEMKARIADAFLSTFQLTVEEARVLKGEGDTPLNESFYKAIQRVKEINERCKLLLRSHNQTAGLQIMESMSIYMEAAFERLYRWVQNECRMQTQDSPEIPGVLCQALEALQDRPVLFKYTLDEYSGARRGAVVKSFLEALTRGGCGSMKPIELHSHDPLRYVGDMLAWLHQATASEKEYLNILLKRCSQSKVKELIQEHLDSITEGVCRPFKMRVEQVLVSDQDPLILYRINNLLRFYVSTLSQLLGADAILCTTSEETQQLCRRLFLNSLKGNARKLLERSEPLAADLSPPNGVQATLRLIQELVTSQDAGVVPSEGRREDLDVVLRVLVEPLLQCCSETASRMLSHSAVDTATFMINSLYAMESALAKLEFTGSQLEILQGQLEVHIDALVNEQAAHILRESSLAVAYSRLQENRSSNAKLFDLPGMDFKTLKISMEHFDRYLSSPDGFCVPQISLLQSGKLREQIRRRAADLVHSAYTQVHSAIHDADNKYDEPSVIAPRTPEQVAKLILNF